MVRIITKYEIIKICSKNSTFLYSRVLNILGDNQSPLADRVNTAQIKVRLTAGQEVFPKPWFGQLMGDASTLLTLILYINRRGKFSQDKAEE